MGFEAVAKGPKEAVDFAEFRPILERVYELLKGSSRGHGDWQDYAPVEVFEVVAEEFDEYREAYVGADLVGPHGQIAELYDLAVAALKGIRRLEDGGRGGVEDRQVPDSPV
jgi:hypothetical protein